MMFYGIFSMLVALFAQGYLAFVFWGLASGRPICMVGTDTTFAMLVFFLSLISIPGSLLVFRELFYRGITSRSILESIVSLLQK